jgi:hypothetical protein
MKSKSLSKKSCAKVKKSLQVFSTKKINQISRQSGFCQRKRKKITPVKFLNGFFMMVSKGINTYEQWGKEIGKLDNKDPVSKQAVWKQMTPATVRFAKLLLQEKISEQLTGVKLKVQGIFSPFNEVHLHDSTSILLPDELVKDFPGNNNCKHKRKAIAKIEIVYNFTKGSFSFFDLLSFSKNDQSLAGTILPFMKPNDLVIRDMGFFASDVLGEIHRRGAYFLTRKPFTVQIYDIHTHNRIDLAKQLKKKGWMDQEVLVGNNKVKMRLVAIPLPADKAAERIRKAKQNRDKRFNHSKEYYTLLNYVIFLTNVPAEIWTLQQVADAYRLRWRIEIIIKTWKSGFNLGKLIHRGCTDKNRVECIIYLMLLFMVIFQLRWYEYFANHILKKYNKHISLLKLAKLITALIEQIIMNRVTEMQLQKQILKHTLYESRKDRIHTMEFYYSLAA